jgi:uncharacterized membrane protein YidH (DUF202 family)
MTWLMARAWLVMALSLLLLGVAFVLVIILANATTGGTDYRPAGPAFVLAAIAVAGICLSMVGLARRPR